MSLKTYALKAFFCLGLLQLSLPAYAFSDNSARAGDLASTYHFLLEHRSNCLSDREDLERKLVRLIRAKNDLEKTLNTNSPNRDRILDQRFRLASTINIFQDRLDHVKKELSDTEKDLADVEWRMAHLASMN